MYHETWHWQIILNRIMDVNYIWELKNIELPVLKYTELSFH